MEALIRMTEKTEYYRKCTLVQKSRQKIKFYTHRKFFATYMQIFCDQNTQLV